MVPTPRVRQFCVDIAPLYDWRNIDAALLREHSVRRICASYKVLQICANLTHASTHALKLREKMRKKIVACAKKKTKKKLARFEPASVYFAAQYSNHSATQSSLLKREKLILYINTAAQIWRKFSACVDACAKYAQIFAQLR